MLDLLRRILAADDMAYQSLGQGKDPFKPLARVQAD
jgi:hypothetical protein